MGGDLLHHEGLGGVPPLIKKADNRKANAVMIRWDLEVPPIVGSDAGSGLGGDRKLHLKDI